MNTLQLNTNDLKQTQKWTAAGYTLPSFDREAVRERTHKAPCWVHLGAGNIFRAFQANVVQNLLNQGILDRGLIVAEGFDYEIIEKINRRFEDLSVLVTLKADGQVEKTVTASVVESIILDSDREKEFDRMKEIFQSESLQMASFTITEKGYCLTDAKGELLSSVAADFAKGPDKPVSYIGKVCALLYTRFLAGQKPIAMVSMDNCSHNGSKLYAAVSAFARAWCENGLAEEAFLSYIKDETRVSFPWTMIDKITPRPDPSIEQLLTADGLIEMAPVITSRNTYVSPFVNAEECEYLVIEDRFPNGRPALEKGGVIFTDRETVDKVEKMKVCTCLNPLHTALAIFGCLLGYQLISAEMKDEALRKLAEGIGYQEGLPVVINPGILDPREFIDTVINVRIPNPFMPDTPQRIATDTSQKLSIRFGETIKAYQASPDLDPENLKLIPLVFAGWLRYLMAVDDEGKPFSLSPDPRLEALCPYVSGFRDAVMASADAADAPVPVTAAKAAGILSPILQDQTIFGVDLCECGLAPLVCDYFSRMCQGRGAVRKTLEETVMHCTV